MINATPAPQSYDPTWMDKILSELAAKLEPPHPGKYQRIPMYDDLGTYPLVTVSMTMLVARVRGFISRQIPDGTIYTTSIGVRNIDSGRLLMPGDRLMAASDGWEQNVPFDIMTAESLGGGAYDVATLEIGQTLALEWDHMTTSSASGPPVPVPEEEGQSGQVPVDAGTPLLELFVAVDLEMARR